MLRHSLAIMKRLLTLLAACSVLAACETTGGMQPVPTPPTPPPTAEFRAADFAWSTVPGADRIDGALSMRQGRVAYSCTGSTVILMPDTPWSRRRVSVLYGSDQNAIVATDVVRSRTPPAPPEFGRYVRSAACTGDRFSFTALPDGVWYVIILARPQTQTAGAGQMAVMRRVETHAGRPTQVVMGS
jgi:hypothetical protein